eukprot:UN17275
MSKNVLPMCNSNHEFSLFAVESHFLKNVPFLLFILSKFLFDCLFVV